MRPADVLPSLKTLRDLIRNSGVPATIVADTAQIPGTWVTLSQNIDLFLDGRNLDVSAEVYLIARDTGSEYAINHLMVMLGRILENDDIPAPSSIRTDALLLVKYQTELPVLVLTFELE